MFISIFICFFLFPFISLKLQALPKKTPSNLSSQDQSNQLHSKIKVIAIENPPFSYLSAEYKNKFHFYVEPSKKKREFLGSDFDIMQRILTHLNLDYEFQVVSGNERDFMLKTGEADIALGIQKTEDTIKWAAFPKVPLRTTNYFFYGLNKKNEKNSMTLQEALAHNFTIGISVGVLYPKIFWKYFPYLNGRLNNHLKDLHTYEDSIRKLKTNDIDLFIGDDFNVKESIIEIGADDIIFQYKNILYSKDYYCAFSRQAELKNKKEIQEQVQKTLYTMWKTDKLKEINQYWLEKKIPKNQSYL